MKIVRRIICCLLLVFVLTGCNKQIFDWNYTFTKVHVIGENKCYKINSWTDYEGEQIQVDIEGYGLCLFNSNQIVLVTSKCPFCEK